MDASRSFEIWDRACQAENIALPQSVRDGLVARYNEPHRAYHTGQHLEECFTHLTDSWALCRRPGAVGLALWFHDAIYDTSRHDNEEQSADLADNALSAIDASADLRQLVRGLILVTRHQAIPAPGDEAVLVDIDLSILGTSPDRFDEYEHQVRKEYAHVPDGAFRSGRAAILQQFLDRPSIYTTERFHQALEVSARENLARSITQLSH